MDRAKINEYVERCQQLIESSPQMNEQNTKVRLIHPFLELLGWDLHSTEVELEYTVQMGSSSTHVDYALLVGDSPVVFVEAKPVNSDITDRNVRQLKSYMRQELDVDWGILTNGKGFEVLAKNHRQNELEEVSVLRFDLDDLVANPGMLELLTKDSIRSGKADEIAEQIAQTNRAMRDLRENEERIAESIAQSVENEVGDLTIDVEEQAREFIQQLVSVLGEQRQFVSEGPQPQPDNQLRDESGQLTNEQQAVLQTLHEFPESPLRTIHEKVTELEGSSFDNYHGEWNDERETIQRCLWELKSMGLAKNEGRSWSPAEEDS